MERGGGGDVTCSGEMCHSLCFPATLRGVRRTCGERGDAKRDGGGVRDGGQNVGILNEPNEFA